MKLITVKKLKKSYSDRELLDIDKFEMEDGEKIGIVGENGVGKSTFLKIILGEVQADEGSINLTDSYYYISQLSDEHKDCTESKIKKYGGQRFRLYKKEKLYHGKDEMVICKCRKRSSLCM